MTANVARLRLPAKVLSQNAFNRFRVNRRWLQEAVAGFSPSVANGARVKPHVLLYGSAVSGTALQDGDADFAVVFTTHEAVPESSTRQTTFTAPLLEIRREQQETVLADLFRHISDRTAGEVLRPQRIFHARVPIVQYMRKEGNGESLKFDISLSVNGVKNSLLLRKYMEQYPRLHLGVMCAKQWGKETKILNARRGWISPYALTIMYVHYMAATGRIPAVLDEATVENHIGDILTLASNGATILDEVSDFNTPLALDETDTRVVENDVVEFFAFYGNPSNFDFDVSVVDIRKNGVVAEKEEWLKTVEGLPQADRWHLLGHENLLLRDPYESHNLGRSVDFFRGEAIREAFRTAAIKREPLSFLTAG